MSQVKVLFLVAILCCIVKQSVLAQTIVCTAQTYRGGEAQVFSDGSVKGTSVPTAFISWVKSFREEDKKIKSVAFTKGGGWVIIWGKNGYRYSNIPSGLVTRLKNADTNQETIFSVAIGPQDQWILLTDMGDYWSSNCPSAVKNAFSNKDNYMTRAEFSSSTCRLWFKDSDGETRTWSVSLPAVNNNVPSNNSKQQTGMSDYERRLWEQRYRDAMRAHPGPVPRNFQAPDFGYGRP